MKKHVISLRKQIFNNLKNRAYSYEGSHSIELIEYKKNQSLLSSREFQKSSIDELLESVEDSTITYIGDFHTFDQNIRNIIRIIKYQIQKKSKSIVALEMVDAKYQLYIDSFLQGHLTELEFLESIEYNESWRFPWSHYRLIFELAKKHDIRIIGINTTGGLEQRDQYASELISEMIKINKDLKLLVLYGELHISKNKIPKKVELKNPNIIQTIVHQNLDEVYWSQIEDNYEFEIIKFEKNEFCINSAPPWIKYESMIYWYENLCDDPDFDIHEYIIENGKKIFSNDTSDNFLILCEQLVGAANLNISKEKYEDFNLYDHTSLDFIQEQIDDDVSQFLLEQNFSFKLLKKFAYYCSSYSVNRLAYLCGMHIFHIYYSNVKTHSTESLFIFKTYEYMTSYFFSKVINPHRKCALYKDFLLLQGEDRFKFNMNILDSNSFDSAFNNCQIPKLILCSMDIGHLLGEYLYHNIVIENNGLNISSFLINFKFDEFNFQKTKLSILKGFKYKEHLKRYF